MTNTLKSIELCRCDDAMIDLPYHIKLDLTKTSRHLLNTLTKQVRPFYGSIRMNYWYRVLQKVCFFTTYNAEITIPRTLRSPKQITICIRHHADSDIYFTYTDNSLEKTISLYDLLDMIYLTEQPVEKTPSYTKYKVHVFNNTALFLVNINEYETEVLLQLELR